MMIRTIPITVFIVVSLFLSGSSLAQSAALKPLYTLPYIVVYGRDSCPFTRNMRQALKREGIKFRYHIIDEPTVRERVYRRMQLSGFSTQDFTLPVVDVNNEILVHPSAEQVIDLYNFGPAIRPAEENQLLKPLNLK